MVGRRLLISLLLAGLFSCGKGQEGPGSPEVHLDAATSSSAPLRDAARKVDHYLVYYGPWDDARIQVAQTYQLVILHPSRGNVTRAQVAAIQGGTNPSDPSKRVLVLGYISIGEDSRTLALTDDQMRADPRFVGDGTGPRMDPRGPTADGQSLSGLDPLGLPSNGGTGFASWYLDDISVHDSPNHVGDGKPDRNKIFHGCFVNPGDPKWFDALQDMTLEGPDKIAGLREILTTTYGRGLGCDGVFLDTIDTCAPNGWTGPTSPNESKFEWTAPGFSSFIQRLRSAYPANLILQNRGMFFFTPYLQHYKFIPRGALDYVLFESYRLNSGSTNNPDPYFYPDNRFNYAPKLMAEANRPDGFRVLSLGYAEGPSDQMSEATLTGGSTLGYDSLIEDIRVTERLAGFRHYLTDRRVLLVNTFVKDHTDLQDAGPPIWTSTYNDHAPGYPTAPSEPTPRVGLQEVESGAGSLTVRWDVALDLNPVQYALYYQTQPFDFVNDPRLTSAVRLVLSPAVGRGYSNGAGPGIFPYEAVVTGLVAGQLYYLVLRAFDTAGNEDLNQRVLTATPSGAASTLGRWRASNGATSLTYRFQYSGSWNWSRVYIDRDKQPGTGFATNGIGADFLIENRTLFRYAGTGSNWSWSAVSPNPVQMLTGPIDGVTFVEWDLNQSDIGSVTRDVNLIFQVERPGAIQTGFAYEHVYTSSDPNSPFLNYFAENDASKIYYHAEIGPTYTWKHLFIDEDANAATGYPVAGIGAGYMIENGKLYRYTGTRPAWGWTFAADAHFVVSGRNNDWWIYRSDVAAPQGFPRFNLIFHANGGSTEFASPVYVHRFSP